jgi:hypothetical protein
LASSFALSCFKLAVLVEQSHARVLKAGFQCSEQSGAMLAREK